MLTFPHLKLSAKKGFTILEILVAAALSIIILVALYNLFVSIVRANQANSLNAELSQNARIALERMTRDIRQAQRIVTVLPATNNDPNNPAPSQIIFQDGHDTSKIQYITYKKDNNNLVRELSHYYFSSNPSNWVQWNAVDNFGDPPIQITTESVIKADRIADLKFYGGKVVNIDLSVSDGQKIFYFKTQVFGRNIQ